MVFDAGVNGSGICIFEADKRLYGRIYSLRGQGPRKDLSIDAGGYRTFDTISPRSQYLIVNRLNLTLGCYDPISCLGKVVVDSEGKRIGFATFLEKMVDQLLQAGVRIFNEHALHSIEPLPYLDNQKLLTFANNVLVVADRVILTMPQYPLTQVLNQSPHLHLDAALRRSVHSLQPVYATKVYLYYEDAWWITKLGHREGTFVAEGNAVSPPLDGRYHDGDVSCNADFTVCHGFLQTNYFWDFTGATQNYFGRFQPDRNEVVTYLNSTADGFIVMEDLHAKLLEYHNLSAADIPGPTEGVMATWNLATPWSNTAWHYWTDAIQASTLQAFLEPQKIHLINEAYSPAQGWAEGAIVLADNMIQDLYGLDPPYAPVGYIERNYESKIWDDAPASLGVPQVCENTCTRDGGVNSVGHIFRNNGACNDGGSGSTEAAPCDFGTDCADCGGRPYGGDGGGAPIAEDPACFTADSLLLLVNGTRIPISRAVRGMSVKSGLGEGVITDVLKHPIHSRVERFRMPTEHGELVGTLTHPVHVNGSWYEAWDAFEKGLLAGLKRETAYVDFFYNLEIDGDKPGASAHAYDLHGVTVSGLGDNEVLNAKFPRQKHFIALAHK